MHIHINLYCVLWEKNRKDALLNGVDEIDTNCNYVENTINENNLKQRIRYRFLKHETVDQLENVFVIYLETYKDQELAETYAAGFYGMNRLRDKWNRDITSVELETKRENVTVFDGSYANPVVSMLK